MLTIKSHRKPGGAYTFEDYSMLTHSVLETYTYYGYKRSTRVSLRSALGTVEYLMREKYDMTHVDAVRDNSVSLVTESTPYEEIPIDR